MAHMYRSIIPMYSKMFLGLYMKGAMIPGNFGIVGVVETLMPFAWLASTQITGSN